MDFLGKTWVRVVAGGFAILLATGGFAFVLMYPAFRGPPPPGFSVPANQAEANRQDLAYLKSTLLEMDRSFTPERAALFNRQIDALSRSAGKLDTAALEMGIAKGVALADNGHTNVLGAARGLTLNAIPLRFYWFSDGLRIVKADPAHAMLLGAKVLTIAGRAPSDLVSLFKPYVGGSSSLRRELSIYLMESPQAMQAIGLQASLSASNLAVQLPDGRTSQLIVVADPTPAAGSQPRRSPQTDIFDARELIWPRRDLSPVSLPTAAPYPEPTGDGRRWTHVLDGRKVPFTLQHPNLFYWATYLERGAVLFVQLNAVMDQPGREPLKEFLARTLEDAKARKPRFAIVDLRSDPGGSYPVTAAFTRDLPALIPQNGKVFILTSANTFSAGLITAARLKFFAGHRGEIVGEPMGDRPQFWAEAATRIVLPNSRLRIGYATGYHDWQNGCSLARIFICYPPNYVFGIAAGDLTPAIPVSWSFADYLAGRDSAVEKVLKLTADSPAR